MEKTIKLAEVSQNGITAYVDSFFKALALFNRDFKTSMSELFMACVYQRNAGEEDTCLGVAYCRVSVSEAKTRISYLFAFDKEVNIYHAALTDVRLLPVSEGSLFKYGGAVWRLLHGRIIVPPLIMDTTTVADIFNRQGICRSDGNPVEASDIKIGRLSFIYDAQEKVVPYYDVRNRFLNLSPENKQQGIGVAFFIETLIDNVEQIVFVRAFRGRHMRSAKWYPKSLTVVSEYGERHSFRSADGEWVLLDGKLTSYEDWVDYIRRKQEEKERRDNEAEAAGEE